MDARGAPERVRDAHVSDELPDLMRRPWPATAWSRFPSPIGSEAGAVPTDHCARPNHCQCVKCCGYQPRQQNEQQAIDIAQCWSVRRFAPEHIDLVAKNQDLRFTPCAGPQQPNERTTKQSEQLNHRPRASPDSRWFRQAQSFRQGQPSHDPVAASKPEADGELEASSRHRDAAITRRGNDRRDDEGNGLAAAFGARLSRRRGAQAAQAEAWLARRSTAIGSIGSRRGDARPASRQSKAPGGLSAMPRVKIGPALPDREHSTSRSRACAISTSGASARWHAVFGRPAPPHLPRHLLFRVLAYRLQADRLGDLDAESQRLLDGSGSPEEAGKTRRRA